MLFRSLDRIDIHIEVVPVEFTKLIKKKSSEKSNVIKKRVISARNIQIDRFKKEETIHCNAEMTSKFVETHCTITSIGEKLIKNAMEKLKLSARAYVRILKVARTIADLDNESKILEHHLAEAIHFRSLDRESWGE